MWKLNNLFLNNQWAKKEISREIRKYLDMNKSKNNRMEAKHLVCS